ncbi:hypothetical protein [Spiroplasma endosymbiont of Nebria brevicollis]|uniref:hypothetical protein n=1 Tax=Spiroplasma endosymbiont of Nebria brevicollis TaxID=3066284 RepID=UPI00313D548D
MNLKKLLMLVAGTVLVVPATLSVVACNEPTQLTKIDSVITTTDLKEITVPSSDEATQPSSVEILAAIDKVDKIDLTVKDVEITNITTTSADVKGIGNYDGDVTVTFTIVKQYSDADIQDAFKSNITDENPLVFSIEKTDNNDTAVKELTDIFAKDSDKMFVSLLSEDMQKQFDDNKLGFYNHVYNSPKNADYVADDFFKNPQDDVKVYFYIAYNATHDTSGIYIPINLKITDK